MESNVLDNLGASYIRANERRKATSSFKLALHIRRNMGDKSGEETTLRNLALTYTILGKNNDAVEHWTQALALARELKDRSEEGYILYRLGKIYWPGELRKAAAHFVQQSPAWLGADQTRLRPEIRPSRTGTKRP